MKSRIYLRRFGKLIKLYKLHRNAQGLYTFSGRSGNYETYHEDGRSWVRAGVGAKLVKYIKQPLSSFSGTETLSLQNCHITGPSPRGRDESKISVRPEDIVIDLPGDFRVEIILSGSRIQLAALPERLNSSVYIKDWNPFLVVEVFQTTDNTFRSRFPPTREYVEGINVFFEDSGRI